MDTPALRVLGSAVNDELARISAERHIVPPSCIQIL